MAKPKMDVGDYVVVEVYMPNHLLPALFPERKAVALYQGVVVKSEAYDSKDSFRMTGEGMMPVRVIAWENVLELNGEPTDNKKSPQTNKTFQTVVKGSKGKEYNVEIKPDGTATCECSGFFYRGNCSHIDKAREQLAASQT